MGVRPGGMHRNVPPFAENRIDEAKTYRQTGDLPEATGRPVFAADNEQRQMSARRGQLTKSPTVQWMTRKSLLARAAGTPNRVERKLKAFPDEVSGGHAAEIDAQPAQPAR